MNKGILITIFVLFLTKICAQVQLRWKVENGPLYYQTVLDVSSTTDFIIDNSDSTLVMINRESAQQFFDLFGKKPCYTRLQGKGANVVEVKISQRLEDSGLESEMIEAMRTELGINENVILRGNVFSDGGMQSYFIENQQKSLLSAGFELPKKPVNKGDIWEIDFSCIDLKGLVITDTASRVLRVKADDIVIRGEDTIVVISYDLSEFMKARTRLRKDEFKEIGFWIKYAGRGEFSVTQGKWLDYNAVFTLETLGIMQGKMKGIFGLRPIQDIPQQYKGD